MKALILTQETCPRCDAQKMFMTAALGGKYDNDVTYVKKEDNPKDFDYWVGLTETGQTPTTIFIKEDEVVDVVMGFNPGKVKKAFETHLKED